MSGNYDADAIQHLEGLDAVRKRPGMYIGDTSSKGMSHLVYEIVDNSVDEALAGYCTRVDVVIHEDGSIEVSDNGRGIPTGINSKSKMSGVALAFTKLHAGGKFGGGGYKSAGGLHGVGASVTNALSERCIVEVRQAAKVHRIEFSRGTVGSFDKAGKFTAKKGGDIEVVGKCEKGETGTRVVFLPDRAIFSPEAQIDLDLVRERLRRTAFLVPTLTIVLHANGETDEFHFTGGISDLANTMAEGAALCPVIAIDDASAFTETVPVLNESGEMHMADVEREVEVKIAIASTNGYDYRLSSFVNIVNTSLGGTHEKGFEQGLLKWARDNAALKAKDPALVIADCLEGLYAVISVGFPEPQFTSQDKAVLGTKPIQNIVADATYKGLTAWMNGRGNKVPAKTLLDKMATAARIRVASKEQRDVQRRKTALEGGSNLPAKLVDCRARAVDHSELFIVEGDSALGTAKAARNSTYQALLPIRGKILNTLKATPKAVLDNAECAAIIQCIGAGSGRTFEIDDMRYERIVMMADADVDGSHIRTLLLTLFWTYMRPIIEEGRLYAAMPPLHRVQTTGRNGDDIFTYTQAEMEQTVARLQAEGKSVRFPVQRYKGLGEMSAEELRETTMSPGTRTLRRITARDAEAAQSMLQLLMGDEVAPRREFIITHAGLVDMDL